MSNENPVPEKISALNHLLKTNEDRIEGYKKSMQSTKDVDLKTLFAELIAQSQKNIAALTPVITALGGVAAEGTTTSGKVYNTWMDVKSIFSSDNREAILTDGEFIEYQTKEAYNEVVNNHDLRLTAEAEQLISTQYQQVLHGYNRMKILLDGAKS